MSRTSRAWSWEIWRDSDRAAELTRRFGELERRFCLSGIRVWVGSVKMSLEIGRRPCSNGSRLGWIRETGFGFGFGFEFGSLVEDEDDVVGSMGSLMALREREREREIGFCRSLRNESALREKERRGMRGGD